MLTWNGQPGNAIAVGAKGIYTIQSLSNGKHVLQGVGHDDMPMLALPFMGREFDTLDHAKGHAGALDRVTAVEPEASGA
jgi:hypothetical protein